ncbi:mucin-4-like isoform X3 [Bolinopsis microptera]|uniref:mucin-4-like isoform X3 n=1 Tax=Bolinopsis microptera TaxID=2820187 RepID=UPI003079FAA9
MVLSSILRRKSVSDSSSQSTDTLDQLTSFLKELENETLSPCAECTRRRLLDLLGNKRQLKLTIKRLSLQSSRLGSTASSLRSDSPISPDIPDILSQLSNESQRSVSTSPMVSPILSPIVSPSLHRVSFQGSSSDGYEIDVDFMLDSAEEPETFIRAPIPKRFRKKNKQKMSDISERDQLMDLDCGQPLFNAAAHKDPINRATRSRHCSADDKPTEGHLEVKETHHWVTRWVSVRGNVVRIKATQEDNTVITSCRMAGWIISSSDEDNKWAILLSKPGSNDEKMMFAAHTRESRDKWIFSLNKCCSNDSLESFRSNSMNGSTITLNTVDKIKDVKEEITFAEYKGYLREKTHMFQWTRRYCFVTKHSLYITLSEENLEPLFEIVLSTISVNPDSELKKPYAFRLISTQIARELFLAAESEEEYDTWLLVLAGKPVPIRDQISHNKAPRSEPAPPAPIPACKMREIAHTKGLLFRLVDGNWICSWCARHHSNLLLYDSENSALPFNSVKLSGADIATDHAHNIYRFLITPSNQDTTLTLGTENITDFERWCASFTMATTIRSRTATGSSSTRGDSFGRKYESSDYCTTSSAERLDNSSQSLPAERFTSGYGSAESLNSVGSGMYENVSKHHSNRNSSEYEDYVNMGHVPPSVPQRQANEMVEEWVDKVQQVEPEYDEHDASQPPDLPEKPRDHVINSKIDNREKLTTREMAANFEEEDEDYAELPPLPESRQPRSEPADKPAEVELVEQQPEPVSVKNSNQSSGSIGFDTSNLLPEVESLELISDREFERMEREILDSADSSERDPSSKVSSSNDLLINQSVDFPFDDLLDQLEELDEPKNLNRLSGNSQQSDMPSEIPTPVSEPESHPSHSSYDIVSQDVSPEEPLEHISEKEILDATENVPSKDRNLRPTSSSPSSSSSSSSSSGTSSSDPPSSTPDDSDKVSETLEDTPKPSHSNVSRLSSLDKLETWDSGLEESLLRTSKILQEATEEHEHRMFPDQLLLKLGSLEDESYKYTDHSAADLPSPVTSSIDSCESPQSDNPPAATKPKAGKPVSKLARPSGLAPPTKLATPSPRTSRNGTLKKCTASRSSDNVSGLPKSRPTSTEGRNSKITSPYGTLPRKKKTVPKQTKLTRSRQNSSEGGIPGPRASPSATSISSPSIGLRKNTSRDSSSGLAAPKKTNTLPRPSRSLARPISGTGLQKPAGLKVPASRETVRSRSSSRESVASSTGDRDSVRRDSGDSATTRSSLSRNNPTERSMRRRLLSTETSKTLTGKRRLSVGTKKIAPEVLRSPSYQNAVSGSDEPSVPKRSTSLRTSGTSSLPGSNSSSPTPRAPAKSRGSTLPTPSSIRSPSRSSAQSPASSVSKLRTVSTSSKTSESRLSRGTEDKTDTPKSILKPPKSETKLPKSGLPAPKSGLKTPSSTGLRKPSSGGIPRPSR